MIHREVMRVVGKCIIGRNLKIKVFSCYGGREFLKVYIKILILRGVKTRRRIVVVTGNACEKEYISFGSRCLCK